MKKQTAVEWLAEKYDLAYWMVKRDEISPALAEEWKKHYLEQAKAIEREQIEEAYGHGHNDGCAYTTNCKIEFKNSEYYYNETYGGDK